MIILGVDPGIHTGIAKFVDGKLCSLETISPHHIPDYIKASGASRVIFEDSRLQSHVWITGCNHSATIKMARNIGTVDAWCVLIQLVCGDLDISAHGISPLGKGAKMKAEPFAKCTGWVGVTNEHERDSAVVAWPYRGAK
jgi:hypothetical protein